MSIFRVAYTYVAFRGAPLTLLINGIVIDNVNLPCVKQIQFRLSYALKSCSIMDIFIAFFLPFKSFNEDLNVSEQS